VEGAKAISPLPEMVGPEALENRTAVGCLLNPGKNPAMLLPLHPFPFLFDRRGDTETKKSTAKTQRITL